MRSGSHARSSRITKIGSSFLYVHGFILQVVPYARSFLAVATKKRHLSVHHAKLSLLLCTQQQLLSDISGWQHPDASPTTSKNLPQIISSRRHITNRPPLARLSIITATLQSPNFLPM